MSLRGSQSRNRRNRRDNRGGVAPIRTSSLDLPGPLAFLANPKLFGVIALVAGGSMVFFLFAGALGLNGGSSTAGMQGNEAPDVPVVGGTPLSGTPAPDTSTSDAEPVVKRYTAPPPLTIDSTKTYTATIQTSKGAIEIELDAAAAPQAVNAFVFLANDGYYDGTPFMELTRDADGGKFYAQAGDPTRTGFGTPGFSVPKELTDLPFARGYVGMGGSAENSNGGQFFISFGDYPALDGKYTIFGKVTAGLDVLDQLALLDLTSGGSASSADEIQSVTIGGE
ncbi:MAG TPA: peptidylprolyl isomerase [Dehalococcoidia bacterium]|nr:peptidylprolyl isomerase [Dehalococcoidia bacterium]